ncbi:erythroblast NAD(P)(+)--arginine ADP-ribosyltransferase-like isoform X2 [Catharus ustulatus]|uniref:erythroblast NAD(P)(+)--arginine ADP-ribosyltransferase-like isoform X2 n=1 Tax=Catharus ustulatus TaxID=91951 RepID=UPI00140902A6|nr:erythroblast NAD(P)(+)--arginine ADP-ribosyltransferase-like isoform X2 [Catharus ustulatus]
MALLALTQALLAMTVATMAITVPLDMALDSFDDQYQGCGPSMEAELPTLNHSEFQNNPHFAKLWTITRDMWWSRGSPVSPLLSPDQAIAVMACTMLYQGDQFNEEVRVAGRSRQAYRDNFLFKTLHFLLTDALATLRAAQGQKCHLVFWGMDYIRYEAKPGDIVRFGEFLSSSLSKSVAEELGNTTMFQVQTCHGVDIKTFGELPEADEVLIPPYEKFKVTKVIEDGEKVEIHLDSIGTYSKYNCEWLTGGSIPRTPASSEDDHQVPQDSPRNKATKPTKVTTATMAILAIMASMWSLRPPLAL